MAMAADRFPAERFAVACEHALVAEAVRAALDERALDAVVVAWPDAVGRVQLTQADGEFQAGLLVTNLDRWSRLRQVEALLAAVPTRWVVLTDVPRGPEWGVVAEGGAVAVLPSNSALDEVAATLGAAARGELGLDRAERDQLALEWDRLRARRADLAARVRTLTPRERQVLDMLYAGDSVTHIAHLLEVSPATVRSQVKAVLRKLGVSSQLAAVAALNYFIEGEDLDAPGHAEPLSRR
jgi:DNA-binding NarL/FixJ family response regulator